MYQSQTNSLQSSHPQKIVFNSNFFEQLIYVSAFLQVIGETLGNSLLIHLKPVPVILMIFMSAFYVKTDSNIIKGLFFGLLGDLCLMIPTTLLLEFGAVLFLIGHLFYIRAFTKSYQNHVIPFQFQSIIPYLATVLIFAILMINSFLLWKYLPNKGLFVLYGFILSLMTASSFYRFGQKKVGKYWTGIVGAVAFLVSDYLIAYSKFVGYQNRGTGALIMLLYYTSQFMILKGNSSNQVKEEQ